MQCETSQQDQTFVWWLERGKANAKSDTFLSFKGSDHDHPKTQGKSALQTVKKISCLGFSHNKHREMFQVRWEPLWCSVEKGEGTWNVHSSRWPSLWWWFERTIKSTTGTHRPIRDTSCRTTPQLSQWSSVIVKEQPGWLRLGQVKSCSVEVEFAMQRYWTALCALSRTNGPKLSAKYTYQVNRATFVIRWLPLMMIQSKTILANSCFSLATNLQHWQRSGVAFVFWLWFFVSHWLSEAWHLSSNHWPVTSRIIPTFHLESKFLRDLAPQDVWGHLNQNPRQATVVSDCVANVHGFIQRHSPNRQRKRLCVRIQPGDVSAATCGHIVQESGAPVKPQKNNLRVYSYTQSWW